MQIITEDLIQEGRSDRGGWTREQLRLLGVPDFKSSPPKGWKRRVIGHTNSDDDTARFLSFGAHGPDYRPMQQPEPRSRVARLIAEGKPLSEIEYPD